MLATSDDSFRASLGWIALAALLASGGVTILTLVRMRGLEIRSDAAQSELRSLSGQLRTAQEQERKYLSRELHDQVGQMLTGLRLELTAVARNQSNLDPQMRMLLDRAKATVEQTLGIVRNIAMLLRPSMLDDLGLTPALAWLVKENSRTSGIDIHKEIDARVDQLPDAHRTCLYRVVQEALTNAARHSGGRHVDLRVTVEHGWVRVRVQDDGRGFVLAQRRRGLGLVGMEERVRELGGYTSVTSVPGRGTCVEIRLPQPATMEDANGESSDRGRSRDRADGVKAAL
jgi:signal transduction histidine kinase